MSMGGVCRTGPPVLPQTEGAKELVRAVKAGAPYAAGKLGTSEFEILAFFHNNPIKSYPPQLLKNIAVNAGLFPHTKESVDAWANHMLISVLPTLDLVAEWNPAAPLYERALLNHFAPKAKRTVLRALEPYYESAQEDQYTLTFPKGAKIAVISPFHTSVAAQSKRLAAVWPAGLWAADMEIIPIGTGYNPVFGGTGWPTDTKTWQEAVAVVVEAVKASGAKYALVGCGALSLPICAELKKVGLCAIHTGGATQILFGIQGRRWDTHSIISTFYNAAWIRPSATEIPSFSEKIEGACYW